MSLDYLIIGAGIIGLSIAKELKEQFPTTNILILEKENDVAEHSSGRNSGVLHAGFYYAADSLKAKFTRDGNALMTKYCEDNNLKINKCQKIVVASNETELESLEKLYNRGIKNGVDIKLISENELNEKFANIKTYKKALYSPNTSTVDPTEISKFIKNQLKKDGVEFRFNEGYSKNLGNNKILTSLNNEISAKKIINCSGLYADKIAKDFGFSKKYTIIPFKGIYLKYTNNDKPVDTNIYPVPNLNNPFLGIHYTITVDGTIKIGPTAIPAFWRENYNGFDNFKINEFFEIIGYEIKLFITNAFNFRALAYEEIKKYSKAYFTSMALKMVKKIDIKSFNQWSTPGIRAQLLDTETLELLQDFVIESDNKSVHILNAVSPAFTCSFSFAKYVVNEINCNGKKS
jgi:L-2-hydroxyglutarate oxidase LhgO